MSAKYAAPRSIFVRKVLTDIDRVMVQLTPPLGLLLAHDLLLAKRGIAAPVSHSLRTAVEKHKARLQAEFTKARLRRKCSSVDLLRRHIEEGIEEESAQETIMNGSKQWAHPRWVRINAIKTSLKEQLATTFTEYNVADTLLEVLEWKASKHAPLVLHIDKHIPDLIALPSSVDLSVLLPYKQGFLILQDKASCFPAYLLDPQPEDRDVVDACAAPGNKTTHLAALRSFQNSQDECPRIWACERDKTRATVLRKMVALAGAENLVSIEAGQDFLRLDPTKEPWCYVGALLLDPSCSGSGMADRDTAHKIFLPEKTAPSLSSNSSRKRKRKATIIAEPQQLEVAEQVAFYGNDNNETEALTTRLQSLAAFQTKLLCHAFSFPDARKVTYSTCSIYSEENEKVVIAALASRIAREKFWRILVRDEQIAGMKEWEVRGDIDACAGNKALADGCIRCNKGTMEGTQGFFVAAFVRTLNDEGEEWNGVEEKGDSQYQ